MDYDATHVWVTLKSLFFEQIEDRHLVFPSYGEAFIYLDHVGHSIEGYHHIEVTAAYTHEQMVSYGLLDRDDEPIALDMKVWGGILG